MTRRFVTLALALAVVGCGRRAPAPDEPLPASRSASPAEPVPAPADDAVANVGLELYPAAVVGDTHVYRGSDGTTSLVQVTSADPPDKLADYYTTQLGGELSSETKMGQGPERKIYLIKIDGDIQYSLAFIVEDGRTVGTLSKVDRSAVGRP